MQIIHLNQYLSNEKTLMQIWALLTSLHMARWLHQSSNLSVLRLSPGMGEYYSPSIKQWSIIDAHLSISYVRELAKKSTGIWKIEYGSLTTIYVITSGSSWDKCSAEKSAWEPQNLWSSYSASRILDQSIQLCLQHVQSYTKIIDRSSEPCGYYIKYWNKNAWNHKAENKFNL